MKLWKQGGTGLGAKRHAYSSVRTSAAVRAQEFPPGTARELYLSPAAATTTPKFHISKYTKVTSRSDGFLRAGKMRKKVGCVQIYDCLLPIQSIA